MERSDRDAERGIYEKYRVFRTDGSSEEGGRHFCCSYFVLDIDHDKFAIPALRAYAEACREKFPALASDLDRITSPGAFPYQGLEAAELMDANKEPPHDS